MENLPSKQCETISIRSMIQAGVKIRDLKNDNPVREALIYAYALVGLKPDKYPTGIERDLLHNFILDTYGGMVADEIKEAFRMAVAGKFEGVDTICYQTFSPEYLGRIMSAYWKFRTLELRKSQKKIEKDAPEMPLLRWFELQLFEPYEQMLKGAPYKWSRLQAWLLFDELKKIGAPITGDAQRKLELINQAKLETPREMPKTLYEKKESDEDWKKRYMKTAKSIAFRDRIMEHAMNETNIRELLTKKINDYELSQHNKS